MENKFVKTFSILVIYYFIKGKTTSRDTHQMWLPELNENLLQIDDRGEFYLDGVHYVDFRGISLPILPTIKEQGLVYVTLAQNKTPGIFEIAVKSTVDELCRLRTPVRTS